MSQYPWRDVKGWFSDGDAECYRSLVGRFNTMPQVLEIGTYLGRSTLSIADILVERHGAVHCVDTWKGSPDMQPGQPGHISPVGTLLEDCTANFERFNLFQAVDPYGPVSMHRCTSEEFGAFLAKQPRSFDLVFIDGLHSRLYEDLVLFWPFVRSGGAIAGHDFPQLRDQVERMFPGFEGVHTHAACFWKDKP